MTLRVLRRAGPAVVLAGVTVCFVASPALAQTTGATGGNIGTFIQTITSRMNLWLNPRVCAATDVSDFDLRDLRRRRHSLYLGVTPDNLARVAPLYNLVLQQLIDLNTRERPTADRHSVSVLVLLDEFARLGHAAVIAHAFAYVAGYGLRLLPVLQSPAQLRAEYGPDLAEEIIANCGVEIAFAPKELKVAQALSERLGTYTYAGRATSRPAGLSSGHRSHTDSDQRRPLMLPQELIQMPEDRLLVLRAGLPPVRGRKIVYWREGVFTRRLLPPPFVPSRPLAACAGTASVAGVAGSPDRRRRRRGTAASDRDDDLRLLMPDPVAGGLAPLPADGATAAEVEAWVARFIDASVRESIGEDRDGR